MLLALVSASIVIFYGAVVLAPVVVEIAKDDLFAGEEIRPQAFETDAWQRQASSYDGTRQAMIQDLLATRPLMGMPESSVLELLGTPNTAPWASASTMIYRLGPEPGPFSVDDEWLILRMEGAHVSKVSIERD